MNEPEITRQLIIFEELAKHLATKEDIANLRTELKGDLASLKTELKGDSASLKTELKGDLASTKGEVASVRADISTVKADLLEHLLTSERGQRMWIWGLYALIIVSHFWR